MLYFGLLSEVVAIVTFEEKLENVLDFEPHQSSNLTVNLYTNSELTKADDVSNLIVE